jgi:RNA polymerase sigma-70 factor (ECF subfamily)
MSLRSTMDARADIRDLLSAARHGAPDAIGQIFEATRGHLLQLAARELPADLRAKVGPSDVVQETAVDMHRDFPQFTGTTAEECFAWLREILRHNVVDAVRHYRTSLKREIAREVRITAISQGDAAAVRQSYRAPDDSVIRREESVTLNDVLGRLPEEYRRVLHLRYWGGMSFIEIAPHLGRSPEAVRKLWYRAVGRLQRELAASQEESEIAPRCGMCQDPAHS